jgi:hypothetical protein
MTHSQAVSQGASDGNSGTATACNDGLSRYSKTGGSIMMRRHILSRFAVVLILALSASVYAQSERWEYLGNAHVDGQQDHDKIHVGRHDGRFRAIQLRVSGGAIYFEKVLVHYGNGSTEELVIRDRIPDGGVTRAIDLPGERRVVESVELWYSKDKWEHRPKVSLFGIR